MMKRLGDKSVLMTRLLGYQLFLKGKASLCVIHPYYGTGDIAA